MPRKRKISDAVELVDRWFGGTPGWDRMVAEEKLKLEIGQAVYDLRSSAGLTQSQLGDLVGTSQSVISTVEHADYDGSAIDLFVRVCFAMRRKVEIVAPGDQGQPFGVACAAG